jgi:LmbE family N-acetylglucosaminyl deacetylase
MRALLLLLFFLISFGSPILAQKPKKSSPSDTYHALQKLNFLGSALYIAAHPDDENTRLISYLANEVKAETAYLSITRGDGGQNLIGTEIRELLGVLRTQELLGARRIDGGQQFFTRAIDFGYSKHPDETLKIWNREEVLSDVVRIIREFQPDVIINRFDHRSPGSTHGHHTSSAMLSYTAFDLANDPKAYPDQLGRLKIWQPNRLFFNTSWWFYGSEEKFKAADKSNMLNFDVGVFYPMLGSSNNEIAALASSQHLSQGFGRLSTRGSENEYLELLKGELPKNKNNLFDGIDTSWSRIAGGETVGKILYAVERNFDFKNPQQHLPELIRAHQALNSLPDGHWKKIKLKELENIIEDVCGLYLEVSTVDPFSFGGGTMKIKMEAINRSKANIVLQAIEINNDPIAFNGSSLKENDDISFETAIEIPDRIGYTAPYWLMETGSLGMYRVADPNLIGKPETPRAFTAKFDLVFNGYPITIEKEIKYRYAKPDKGELYEPFDILPEATASFKDKVMIFSDGRPKDIPVTVKAYKDAAQGELQLQLPEGWQVDLKTRPFNIAKKGDQQILNFTITPPNFEDEARIGSIIKIGGKEITKELVEIKYDHIPKQSVLLPSEAKVVRLDIRKIGNDIGYIMGAGDDVPTSLEQIGYDVHLIDPETITDGSLDRYDAVVTGIRAYNVVDALQFKQKYLLEYVKNGGNLIIQYNTAGRWNKQFEGISPYPLTLSNDRVTDENSPVAILAPEHPLIKFPNPIGENDFNGWVQERGLYFPEAWDATFTPILSMKDEGEQMLNGSLLIAPYGKGNYIYTGLSFFRELPAGVPGAYKLFANMLSIGKQSTMKHDNVKG